MNIIGNTEDRQYLSLVKTGPSCYCSVCQEMDQVQSQILVTEGQQLVDEIEIRLRHLKREKNRTHSLIYEKLPPELISIIFTHCIPTARHLEYRHESGGYRNMARINPLRLGHICKYWREIAWSTPRLWNQLFLVLLATHVGEKACVRAGLAHEWLDRSGNLPLSLYIHMDYDDYSYYDVKQSSVQSHPVFEIVKQYSQRWQDLYMTTWTSCTSHLRLDVTQIPNLRTFIFRPMGQMEPLWWDFQITPRRVYFDLGLVDNIGLRCFDNISWGHLIDITLSYFTPNDNIQILKAAPQLTKFKIIEFDSDSFTFKESDQVIHSKLQSFTIAAQFQDLEFTYDTFLSVLNFPSLEEFHSDVRRSQGVIDDPYLFQCPSSFLGRLKHLRSLSIQLSLSLDGEKYIDVLKDWPSLESLFLIDIDTIYRYLPKDSGEIDDHTPYPLLSLLSATYNNQVASRSDSLQPFLPTLRTFGYRARYRVPPWKAILNIVGPLSEIGNSHRRPLNSLTFEITFSAKNLDPALVRQLAGVKEAGIDVILRDIDYFPPEDNEVLGELVKALELNRTDKPPTEESL